MDNLPSIPRKMMEKLILEMFSRHMKDKKINRCCQHGFTQVKSCLTNLTNLCDEMVSLMDEGRTDHIAYVDYINAFDSVSHNILTEKLLKYMEWMSRL